MCKRDRIERKIKKKKDVGSDLKLNYRLLVHDIIQKDDQFLLVSEVFYPEYRANTNNMMGINSFYGNPWLYGSPFGSGLYNPCLLYTSRCV